MLWLTRCLGRSVRDYTHRDLSYLRRLIPLAAPTSLPHLLPKKRVSETTLPTIPLLRALPTTARELCSFIARRGYSSRCFRLITKSAVIFVMHFAPGCDSPQAPDVSEVHHEYDSRLSDEPTASYSRLLSSISLATVRI